MLGADYNLRSSDAAIQSGKRLRSHLPITRSENIDHHNQQIARTLQHESDYVPNLPPMSP